MERSRTSGEVVRGGVALGHVAVGVAGLGLAAVLVRAGTRPNAELAGVLWPYGVILGLIAGCFTLLAVRTLREPRDEHQRRSSSSMALCVVELVVGLAMAVAVVNAVSGYRAFEPWRSPLLPPAVALIALGLSGLVAEGRLGRLGRRDQESR